MKTIHPKSEFVDFLADHRLIPAYIKKFEEMHGRDLTIVEVLGAEMIENYVSRSMNFLVTDETTKISDAMWLIARS